MRVLHVITGLGTGGAEQQLAALVRRLPAHGDIVCDVITLTNPGAVADRLRADGVRVGHLGMAGNRDLAALPRLTRAIRRGRYDVVHTHLYRAGVYGRIAARAAGVRAVVATEHSLGEERIEGRPLTAPTRGLYLATERLGHATVAVSAAVARRLRQWGVPAERLHVVPNGIEPTRYRCGPSARRGTRARLGIAPDAFVVAGVGRLVPGKRFDQLVRAVAAVPTAVLVLVGDGPERARLLRLAAGSGAARPVRFLGDRSAEEVPTLLAACDALVSPSREETFGLAVLEGLAAGLPVLHASCPALEELPADHAPGAARFDGGLPELTTALRALAAAGPVRLPQPRAVRHYDIGRAAESLTEIYRRTAARAAATAGGTR
ncbi:glycosyltransferase [Streptomyces spiramenti]|uniref:Glycosyltransferase n=1 Tax=Streptomyces spiramenti TaxID=2720606 RepID=A0ABX1AQ90_9ACTN|nr:glycosyltransferase [Streptomyces spiramenti]NJP69254.1 glycosyltransferase [Streptomyces spiramenti]